QYSLLCPAQIFSPSGTSRVFHCTSLRTSRDALDRLDDLNASTEETVKTLDSSYNAEQRMLILQCLNTASESELEQFKLLRGKKAINIVKYRNTNGQFTSLESVVNVPLMKHKSAVTAFDSMLNLDDKRKKAKSSLVKFIKPDIDRSVLEDASSVISIVCGSDKISWVHMDKTKTVLEWQQTRCPSFMSGTYMPLDYLEDISAVISSFPAADLFLVEKSVLPPQNTSLFPVIVHLRTVEAMLFALLSQEQKPGSPKVLNMMRSLVGRHFGLMLGQCRTSGVDLLKKMMKSRNEEDPRVLFPHDRIMNYSYYLHSSSKDKGDEMCDSLLQALAFFELLEE
ncbi:hypothetical protein DNTS_034985, partial [Danionella cerebrum]